MPAGSRAGVHSSMLFCQLGHAHSPLHAARYSGRRLSQLLFSLKPVVPVAAVFGATLLVEFVGSPRDIFIARLRGVIVSS